VAKVPPVAKRMPVVRSTQTREWMYDKKNQTISRHVPLNAEMKKMKAQWKKKHAKKK
jgi:hypothetical protein